jgi:hypothetical protein
MKYIKSIMKKKKLRCRNSTELKILVKRPDLVKAWVIKAQYRLFLY